MTANTPLDFELKCGLLDDTFSIIDMEKMYPFHLKDWLAKKNKLEDSI